MSRWKRRRAGQLPLFDRPKLISSPGAPDLPPTNATPTSQSAAVAAARSRESHCRMILDAIAGAGQHGRTCDELEVLLGLPHQTVGPRVKDLADDRKIAFAGFTRLTRRNCPARVWVTAKPGGWMPPVA